jgi:hypothetical protein
VWCLAIGARPSTKTATTTVTLDYGAGLGAFESVTSLLIRSGAGSEYVLYHRHPGNELIKGMAEVFIDFVSHASHAGGGPVLTGRERARSKGKTEYTRQEHF